MTLIWDVTIQHHGWSTGSFATGGWQDLLPPAVTGLQARSFFAQSLNGQAIDQAISFADNSDTALGPNWINVHSAAPQQALTSPSPFLVTSGVNLGVFTRVPANNLDIAYRITVSDQGVTNNPLTPPCQYGTEPIVGNVDQVIITSDLVATVCAAVGFPELAVFFAGVVGATLAIKALCSSSPPLFPVLDPVIQNNSIQQLLTAFESAAWFHFCHCVAGSPAPIPFPPTITALPPGTPTAPTFPCDPANLCASIARIETLLNQVSGTLASNLGLTTLLQRYSLPFAVIPSAFHAGLSSFGSFSISRLVGIQYQVSQLPPNAIVRPGAPQYIRDLGWVGFELPSGGVKEHRVTRQQELWLPEEAQLSTSFAWDLTPGTVIDVRELLAEP